MIFPDVPDAIRKRMSSIRGRDTRPELVVRRLAHSFGYRFRLHLRNLPGQPDLVFPRHRKVIFVHGCFWHQHACRLGAKKPATRPEYWLPKLERNAARDVHNCNQLERSGWRVMVVWECETQDQVALAARIKSFLSRVD